MSTAEAPARALHGSLRLRFAALGGRTRLLAAERTPPLHVQRLLPVDPAFPRLAGAVLLNTTAGLCADDVLSVACHVESGGAIALTTPTMTRAFSMPAGRAELETVLTIADGAYLEYLPEPVLLCAGAALRQRVRIEAAPGAWVVAGEAVAFGRIARGEVHAYRELDLRTAVGVGGQCLLVERLHLTPGRRAAGLGALGGFAAYGSMHMLCPPPESRALLAAVRAILAGQPTVQAGASLLQGEAGIAIRALAAAPAALQGLLRELVALFRARHAGAIG